MAPGYPGGNGPYHPNSGYGPGIPPPMRRKNNSLGLIISIVIVALIIVGVGCWWYFGYRDTHPILTDDIDVEQITEMDNEAISTDGSQPGLETAITPQESGTAATMTDGAPAGSQTVEASTLFNRPLLYTGTVTPGGVASLNIILFQNGRLEGTIDYSGGKSMPLFGSYTWTDDGHMMNINFTVSSNDDKTYSESWMGTSSYIKDDLTHTLTFKRINTSEGQSKTASFALRP